MIIIKIDIFTTSPSSVFHLLSGEWQLIFSWGIVGIFILPTNSESLINCSSETERVWYSLIPGWLVSLYSVCSTCAKLLKCFQKAVNIILWQMHFYRRVHRERGQMTETCQE